MTDTKFGTYLPVVSSGPNFCLSNHDQVAAKPMVLPSASVVLCVYSYCHREPVCVVMLTLLCFKELLARLETLGSRSVILMEFFQLSNASFKVTQPLFSPSYTQGPLPGING